MALACFHANILPLLPTGKNERVFNREKKKRTPDRLAVDRTECHPNLTSPKIIELTLFSIQAADAYEVPQSGGVEMMDG